MFITAFFTIAKTTQTSTDRWTDKRKAIGSHRGILFSHEKAKWCRLQQHYFVCVAFPSHLDLSGTFPPFLQFSVPNSLMNMKSRLSGITPIPLPCFNFSPRVSYYLKNVYSSLYVRNMASPPRVWAQWGQGRVGCFCFLVYRRILSTQNDVLLVIGTP